MKYISFSLKELLRIIRSKKKTLYLIEMSENTLSRHQNLEAILDRTPPDQLAAFVERIPLTIIDKYAEAMFKLYIVNYITRDDNDIARELLAIYNYLLDGAALPESLTERRKLQLAAYKRVIERASDNVRIMIWARRYGLRLALNTSQPSSGGRRHTRKQRSKRRSQKSRRRN